MREGFLHDTTIIAKTQEELQDMVNRLVDTRKKYDIEMNDKFKVMRVGSRNELLINRVRNGEL